MYLRTNYRCVLLTCATLALCASFARAQQATGSLRGRVVDQLEASIVNASVSVSNAEGEQTAVTNERGEYHLGGLKPGKYVVRSTAPGFAAYEKADVEIDAGRPQTLDIKLLVTVKENVDIG